MTYTSGKFELVLGTRELVILFFLMTALFTGLLAFGYSVGHRQSELTDPAAVPPAASPPTGPAEQTPNQASPPQMLLEAAPKPEVVPGRSNPPSEARMGRLENTFQSVADRATSFGWAGARSHSAPERDATGAGPELELQVAALRDAAAAQSLTDDLRAKGYPAASNRGHDGWYRVVVGSFGDPESAKTYQKRLNEEGHESFLRQR